jgi:hypothetical protein
MTWPRVNPSASVLARRPQTTPLRTREMDYLRRSARVLIGADDLRRPTAMDCSDERLNDRRAMPIGVVLGDDVQRLAFLGVSS